MTRQHISFFLFAHILLFGHLSHSPHSYYRHVMLQGPVNDENAYAMGGVAGHAGGGEGDMEN